MRRWNNHRTSPREGSLESGLESGRASIEFLVFTIVVFIPMVFLIQSLWAIQAAAIAVEQASRDAVRVFIQHRDLTPASANAEAVARRVIAEHGVTGPIRLERSCQPASCLSPGALVSIRLTTEVTLWQVPLAANAWPLTIPVTASNQARVSAYGGAG
jgi:hypothetical protein